MTLRPAANPPYAGYVLRLTRVALCPSDFVSIVSDPIDPLSIPDSLAPYGVRLTALLMLGFTLI